MTDPAMPAQASPDPAMILDNQLCFSVYSASHAFTRAYRPLLSSLGVTYPQYLVMLVLWQERQASVGVLCARLGLDSGTLSPLLKRLEKAGLVQRLRDRADERIVNVTLTPAGVAAEETARTIKTGIGQAVGCRADELIRLKAEIDALTARLHAAAAASEAA